MGMNLKYSLVFHKSKSHFGFVMILPIHPLLCPFLTNRFAQLPSHGVRLIDTVIGVRLDVYNWTGGVVFDVEDDDCGLAVVAETSTIHQTRTFTRNDLIRM
jgi:hypothetical protein